LIAQLSPGDLATWRNDAGRTPPVVIDVREPWEYDLARIADSRLVSLQTIPSHVDELPRDRDLVLVCHHGNRSQRAAQWLEQAGFTRLFSLAGGVEGWASEVDPTMPHY
jgi:rhodanese-related sulfurtransferase